MKAYLYQHESVYSLQEFINWHFKSFETFLTKENNIKSSFKVH